MLSDEEWQNMTCIVKYKDQFNIDTLKLFEHLSNVTEIDKIESIVLYNRCMYQELVNGDIPLQCVVDDEYGIFLTRDNYFFKKHVTKMKNE